MSQDACVPPLARIRAARSAHNPDQIKWKFGMSVRKRNSTPSWLLPPPVSRLREHLQEIRRPVGETQHQLIDASGALTGQLAELEGAVRAQAAAISRIEAQIDELVKRRRAADVARQIDSLKLFTSVYDDVRLLPHFLRHYSDAGVDHFYILTAPEFESDIKALSSGYHVTTGVRDDLHRVAVSDTDTIWEMRNQYQGEDEWVVLVDLDEFVDFEDSIPSIIASAEVEDANVVRGVMYDRFSADGKVVDFDPALDLPSQYPVRSRFIRDVMDGCDYKAVLVKEHLEGGKESGHHFMIGERIASTSLVMDHYRWAGKSLELLRERTRLARDLGKHWWVQYDRALQHYESHGGRFAWQEFGGELVRH